MKTSALIAAAVVLSAVSLGMTGAVPMPFIETAKLPLDAPQVRGTTLVQEEGPGRTVTLKESRLAKALSKELMAYRAVTTSA